MVSQQCGAAVFVVVIQQERGEAFIDKAFA